MPLLFFAIGLLVVAVASGYLRFTTASSQFWMPASAVFVTSTACFVMVLLKILAVHLRAIGRELEEDVAPPTRGNHPDKSRANSSSAE